MIPPDLVYFVRRGEYNEELRYSLRTVAANLPHERVWIVGDQPSWVREVGFMKGNKRSSKWENGPDNLRIACEQLPADVQSFVVMNDDFFVMRPVDDLPPLRRFGTLHGQVSRVRPGPWHDSLARTYNLLLRLGVETPLSYELHVPVVMEREKLREAIAIIQSDRPRSVPAQWRTVYGNVWKVEAAEAKDRKSLKVRARDPDAPEPAFDSSDDRTFRAVQRPSLSAMFPEPSRYEGEARRMGPVGWMPPRRRRGRQGTIG